MNENRLREEMCEFGRSFYERGLSPGSSGNMSVRLEDGYLFTPTNSCLGRLDPARLSKLDGNRRHVAGDPPTKECPLHFALYGERPGAGAVVHLHSTHCVALSCLRHGDPDNCLPAATPYFVMRLGRLLWVPYHPPGSEALGGAVKAAAAKPGALLMANHGPVVSDKTLSKAVYAMEELEEAARIHFLIRSGPARHLAEAEIRALEAPS